MKKNLVYYSIGFEDDYSEMLKISLESLDYSNTNLIDVLIITDEVFYQKNLKNINRSNLYFLFFEKPINKYDTAFNRLKIFFYERIFEYDNLFYLDVDTIVNTDLNKFFNQCNSNEKFYGVVEDYNIENHRRIQFGFGNYSQEEIDFFKKNNIFTMNTGTFMIKSSEIMKSHFQNILNFIKNYTGEFFWDQTFINFYFNKKNLTNTEVIKKDLLYSFVVEENFDEKRFFEKKIFHILTETNYKTTKLKKMEKILSEIKNEVNFDDRSLWIENFIKFLPKGKGVEVGVFKGELSKKILENWNGTLYMVDVWAPLGQEYLDISNIKDNPDAYKETMENIKGYEDRGIMIRSSSKIASEMFEDESLDFIFIDANHAYDFVVEDLNLWFPKLKKGGVFSGHDYILLDWYNDPNFLENRKDKHIYTFLDDGTPIYTGVFGVNPAVDEFSEKYGYKINHTKEWFSTWWFVK